MPSSSLPLLPPLAGRILARTVALRRVSMALLWSAIFFVTMALCCIAFVAATLSPPAEQMFSSLPPLGAEQAAAQAAQADSFGAGARVAQAISSMQESNVFWGLFALSLVVAMFGAFVEVLPGTDTELIRRELAQDAAQALPTVCPNCAAAYQPDALFCHSCGQERQSVRSLTMGRFAVNALPDTLNVDGRFLPTLWLLLTKPGFLTREYMSHRRMAYSAPLQVYAVVTALFFFVSVRYEFNVEAIAQLPGLRLNERIAQRAALDGTSTDVVKLQLDDQLQTYLPFYTFVIVIALACVLRLVYRRRTYAEHLIFSMHCLTTFLLGWIAFILIGVVLPPMARFDVVLATLVAAAYIVLALRTDYQSMFNDVALWKPALVVLSFAGLVAIYTAISLAFGILAL
jgi:hypothetical protein